MKRLQTPDVTVLIAFALFTLVPSFAYSQTTEVEPLVPQSLLKLVHTHEVQKELGLEGDARLLEILKEMDRVWWPSRNLPEAKQLETTRELETRLIDALSKILSPATMRRLRELEIQSQGTRALVRPEIAGDVGLDAKDLRKLKAACLVTDSLASQLNEKSFPCKGYSHQPSSIVIPIHLMDR